MSRATLGESVHMSSEHMDSRNIHISIKALLDRPYLFKKYLNTKNSKLAFTAWGWNQEYWATVCYSSTAVLPVLLQGSNFTPWPFIVLPIQSTLVAFLSSKKKLLLFSMHCYVAIIILEMTHTEKTLNIYHAINKFLLAGNLHQMQHRGWTDSSCHFILWYPKAPVRRDSDASFHTWGLYLSATAASVLLLCWSDTMLHITLTVLPVTHSPSC